MSQAPSVALIEAAAESLPNFSAGIRNSQQSELAAFGAARAQNLGASGLTTDFQKGYELGLQTAREAIATNPFIAFNNLDPSQIL